MILSEEQPPPALPSAPPDPLRLAAKNPAVALTVVGAITYAFIRIGHEAFYSRFRVDPDEVGLGYAQTLTRGGPTVFIFILVYSLIPPLVSAFDRRGLPAPTSSEAVVRAQAQLAIYARFAAILTAFTALLILISNSVPAIGDSVEDGDSVTPSRWVIPDLLSNPLRLSVPRVRVRWVSDQHPKGLDLDGSTVSLLGKAEGTVVLYRVRNGFGETLRLPQDTVVMIGEGDP